MALAHYYPTFIVPSVAALLLACSAAEDTETSGAASTGGNSDSASESEASSESGATSAWPDCQPVTLARYGFSLATSSGQELPAGELLTASCVFRSITAAELPPEPPQLPLSAWDHTLTVDDCVDAEGEPIDSPLGVVFVTGEAVELELADGDMVEVQVGRNDVGDLSSQVWYSLRRAAERELVFAAFGDLGPSLGPKLSDQPAMTTWLAPLEVELGPFACAVDNAAACAAPQRALAHFITDGQTTDVVSGTIADVGPYRVHLGYAGDPDVCEGSPTNMPLEGLVFTRSS